MMKKRLLLLVLSCMSMYSVAQVSFGEPEKQRVI